MFGSYSQHFCVALRAAFFLAWDAVVVWHSCVALGADTLATAAHHVLSFSFGHSVSSFVGCCDVTLVAVSHLLGSYSDF